MILGFIHGLTLYAISANRKMNELELKYQCSEFFEVYYSRGLFHPTECQMLYSHENIFEEDGCLIIGEVYDDHDFKICYKRSDIGIWEKSNYDNSILKHCEDLKELTEGWYQVDSNHWCAMDSGCNLDEIIKFYQINDSRYSWHSESLIELLKGIRKANRNSLIFAKGHKGNLNVSSTNGFISRPRTKMITVQLDEKDNLLKVFHQSNFFDYDVQSKNFKINEIERAVNSILEWLN